MSDEQSNALDFFSTLNSEEWLAALRNEIFNANQTTRVNLGYILGELQTLPPETPLDYRLIEEYAERIRSAADRITHLINSAVQLYDQGAPDKR
ncbi:MAG: hypothetical protein HXY40_19270 [Chloroflexi bacterium]|nr:hypothetical protein [Chloroflexota bacterium]